NHFSTLSEYCKGITIPPPKWEDFDYRSFEDNMVSVRHKMEPFKHEFYAIALKISGGGKAKLGNYQTTEEEVSVFFNSPYQILSWDIPPDWKGYYVIFTEDFYRGRISMPAVPRTSSRITDRFPFLLVDNTLPILLDEKQVALFSKIFQDIEQEFVLASPSSKEVIAYYVHILLIKISRLYQRQPRELTVGLTQRAKDVALVNRFKSLLEISFHPGKAYTTASPHQVQYYAEKLSLHPSHFNAIVKRITDIPVSEHIQEHIFSLAKSQLVNTTASVKEIAFGLYYPYANHFTSFFKKRAQMTPSQYRKQLKP
ncbi:MAG: helix-turn-helix domain-containing protein, partial [Bacteroidota bacterium]